MHLVVSEMGDFNHIFANGDSVGITKNHINPHPGTSKMPLLLTSVLNHKRNLMRCRNLLLPTPTVIQHSENSRICQALIKLLWVKIAARPL